MIWRDDDILWGSHGLDQLLEVDDLFQKYDRLHTVAVIVSTLTPDVAKVLIDRRMSVQLHCWTHEDLTQDLTAVAALGPAVEKIHDLVGVRPTVLYPPWNRSNASLESAAADLGLTVSWEKASLEQFIRFQGRIGEETINFHYWCESDRIALSKALRIDAGLQRRTA